MKKTRVFVFPCGSEIGLEIHNALKFSSHIKLFGGSSVSDHGKFVYKNYIDNIPYVHEKGFVKKINSIIDKYKIDFIFPAHDDALLKFAENEKNISCPILTSPKKTVEICRSKLKTYEFFKKLIRVPKIYSRNDKKILYPVFLKPESGQGSKGVYLAKTNYEVGFYMSQDKSLIIIENLPGKEYTIDCFTDRNGKLRFVGARERSRISNGISVNTKSINNKKFYNMANIINSSLKFRGVWFFQVKKNKNGDLVLMEIAPRVAGAMGMYRNKGINLSLITIFDRLNKDINIIEKKYSIEMDKALFNRFSIDLRYKNVYVDLDDCIILEKNINWLLIGYFYQCISKKIPIHLITKHKDLIDITLTKYKISSIFSTVIHLNSDEEKYKYITKLNSIFIDDSFSEREKVFKYKHIPVFDISEIESLLDWRR